MKYDNFSILVNSCDAYSDCWDPFFKLFNKYWPEYKGKIYLNTEYKNYDYEGLDICCLKVCEENQDRGLVTWSECLARAIEKIGEEVILYLQEDYFFKDFVKNKIFNKYLEFIRENKEIDCIHLTDQAVTSEKYPSEKYTGLFPVLLKQRFRVSCQAALWKSKTLLSYLRSYENAWQFEEFASKRSAFENHTFYVVDRSWVKLNEFEIIPYIFTGIIQGRWNEEVKPLFSDHNIEIDYQKRGYVSDAPKKSTKNKIIDKWNRIPVVYKYFLDMTHHVLIESKKAFKK